MRFPSYLRITCLADGVRVQNVFVLVKVIAKHKNDFSSLVGPSDPRGSIELPWSQVQAEAEWNRNTFPMDYTGLADATGDIVVRPVNREGVARAIEGYQLYKAIREWPIDYIANLQASSSFLNQLDRSILSVEVEHDGDGIMLRTESVEV